MPIPSLTMHHLTPPDTSGHLLTGAGAGKLIPLRDVQHRLGISKRGVTRLVRRQEIAVVRIGRRTLVHPDDLARFIDRCRRDAA